MLDNCPEVSYTRAMTDTAAFQSGSRRLQDAMTTRELSMAQRRSRACMAATPDAKAQLRARLAESADAALVAELRAYFNTIREDGDTIRAEDVSAAMRLLRG